MRNSNNMATILITGANGQLGQEFQELAQQYSQYEFIFVDRKKLDISKETIVKTFFKDNAIDIIINCAAYTAVDKAESEVILADTINHKGVSYLAQSAKEYQIKLIHISTDYVFNGEYFQPYAEEHSTSTCNVYGASKRAGEEAMQIINPENSLIIRTSWLYSSCGNNFVKTMLKLGKEREFISVVCDQVGTPTYAKDLAISILDCIPSIKNKNVEIYHYSNEGVLSWFDFAKEIMKMAKLPCKIIPIETKEYPTPAKRPYYSLLNKSKIKRDFNLKIPYWKDSLDICLQKMGERK